MKNSKEYSKKIQKLYRSLKREYPKVQKVIYEEPAESLVYAVVSENTSEAAAQSMMKRIAGNFIDLNDLRVSLTEEIVETLGTDIPSARDTASRLSDVLRSVFNEHNTVSLAALIKTGKRPARQSLEKMEGISPFVVDYCMLTALQGHAVPLTEIMILYLKSGELVYDEADYHEIEGFLARQISAENAYEFYALLRRESETVKIRTRTKSTRKTKASAKKTEKTKKKLAKKTKKKG